MCHLHVPTFCVSVVVYIDCNQVLVCSIQYTMYIWIYLNVMPNYCAVVHAVTVCAT
jgi:hypothetical protein